MPARRQVTPEVAARRARIVDLRARRWTWAAIAADVGVSITRVRQVYDETMAAVPARAVDEHRLEELDLIDTAERDLLSIALDRAIDPRVRVDAWTAICGWAGRKAKLLGLDVASRVVPLDALDTEIERLVAEMGGPSG